jgi:hypothetical protein
VIIGGINNLNQYATMMARRTQLQNTTNRPTVTPVAVPQNTQAATVTISTRTMSLDQLDELVHSDMTLKEKTAKIREEYGIVISEEVLALDIKAIKDGRFSTAQLKASYDYQAFCDTVSPGEVLRAFIETDPNRERVERSKALAAKFRPIQDKMLSGKLLTAEEKSFMQEHFPDWIPIIQRIEQEIQQLRNELRHSSSKEEKDRIITEKKMLSFSGDGNFSLFMIPAIDAVVRNM